MGTIDRRLTALEQRQDTGKGLLIFQQTIEDENIFHKGIGNDDGVPFTRAEVQALAEAGWQILTLEYVHDWRPAEP